MGNPFDQFDTQGGPVYGSPRQPSPQTPAQATGDQLGVVHQQQQIDQVPLQNENTRVNIDQGRTSIQNQRFNQNQGLRQEFNNLPEVKNYSAAIGSLGSALKAPDSPQGDLSVVYAYAKAMDPGSVVREGEMDMATATASIPQAYQADVQRLTQGKRLPPEVRTGLVEAMRQSVSGLRQTYDQQRNRYGHLATQNGFDPTQVIGHPLYDAYRPAEEAYITAHGGTPKVAGAPVNPDDVKHEMDTRLARGDDPADIIHWLVSINRPPNKDDIALIIANKGNPDVNSRFREPDSAAMRGLAEGAGGVVQGVGDILGTVSNPFISAVNAATGTDYRPDMGANLRDAVGLPAASTPGQEMVNKVGSAAMSGLGVAGAAKAAIPYAGEALSGALTGLAANPGADAVISGSSGGASEGARQSGYGPGAQMLAALAGGVASAPLASRIAPTMLPAAKNALMRQPQAPLVDPTSGRLNEPLEAAGPAARVQAAKDFGIDIPMGSAGDRTAAIIERKLDVRPASAGVMNDHRRLVENQVQNAVEDVASKFGSAKTLNEMGSEAQSGMKSWMNRADQAAAKVFNAISISPKAPTQNTATVATLQDLTGKLEGNPALQEEIKDPILGRYLTAIQEHGLNWQDMKDFRSYIGNKIGQFRFSQDSRTGDYRALYGALSEDMKTTASAQGPKQLREFERANSFYAAKEQRVEQTLSKLLGNDMNAAPEAAAKKIQSMTMGGKGSGDLKALAQVRASTVKDGSWDEIAGALVRVGGQPADSPGRGFDPGTFVRWYSDMAEPARAMLFKPELRKTLDQFVMVNQRLANSNALRNTSNTAMASPTGSFSIPTAAAALFTGHPIIAGGIVAGTAAKTGAEFGMSKLWTSPKFVQWATGYSRATASGNGNAVKSQIGRIGTLAAANPELREPLIALQQRMLSHANDNLGRAAASQNDQQNSR